MHPHDRTTFTEVVSRVATDLQLSSTLIEQVVMTTFDAIQQMLTQGTPHIELPQIGVLTPEMLKKMQTAAAATWTLKAREVGAIRAAIRRGEPLTTIAQRLQRPRAIIAAFLADPADDNPRRDLSADAHQRFWSLVDRIPTATGCLLWCGRTDYGWGRFYDNGSYRQAQRVAYQLACEDALPAQYHVIQECGERLCVQLDHLVVVRQHGGVTGEAHGLAKLTDHQIRTIRQRVAAVGDPSTEPPAAAALAREYAVVESTIRRIVAGMRRRAAGGPLPPLSIETWQAIFLAALRDGYTDEQAAAIADIDIVAARAERHHNRRFATAWLQLHDVPEVE